MSGAATHVQVAAFLTALRMKGETVDELIGLAEVMRLKAARVRTRGEVEAALAGTDREMLIDTAGTGGDASGTFNSMTQQAAWSRMEQAGAQLMTWFGAACELHRDWRNDIEGLGTLFSNHIPDYRNLMNSYSTLTAARK